MNKILSILVAIPVILSTYSAPTLAVAQEQGTHSSERPGLYDLQHPPRRHRWIYDENDQQYDGERDYRPHYRHYRNYDNDAFIPGAAAILGLGLMLGSQPRYAPRYVPRQRVYSSHVQYCMSRYRSYRAWDNTYQPSYGPRRVCR